jgi:hypothetical protein
MALVCLTRSLEVGFIQIFGVLCTCMCMSGKHWHTVCLHVLCAAALADLQGRCLCIPCAMFAHCCSCDNARDFLCDSFFCFFCGTACTSLQDDVCALCVPYLHTYLHTLFAHLFAHLICTPYLHTFASVRKTKPRRSLHC